MKLQWNSCVKIGVTAFILYLCMYYWSAAANLLGIVVSAALPLIIGCVIAYIVNILMSFYERHYFPQKTEGRVHSSRRPVCMLLAFITLIALVVLIVWLVVPQLADCVSLLFAEVPDAIDSLLAFLSEQDIVTEDLLAKIQAIDWQSKIQQMIDVLLSGVGNVIQTVSSVVSGVVTVFLSLIFAIYLLLGRDKLQGQVNRLMGHYVSKKWNDRLHYVFSVLNDCFHRYIVGQCTEAVILGVLCIIGMLILRLPYATMIGTLIGFTALIPVAGAYIGGAIGAFMIFTVEPIKAVVFLVFLVILQQVEGNLIYPKVVGSSLGLPALWVLAAVTVGGGLLGIPGMLLGVPLTSAVYRLIKEDMGRKDALIAAAATAPETVQTPETTA